MRAFFFLLLFVLRILSGFAQPVIKDEKLYPVEKPVRFVQKYINFDVVKLTLGHGGSTGELAEQGFASSFDVQLLWPIAFFKKNNHFHVAWGTSFGRNTITYKFSRYEFTVEGLKGIIPDNDIKRTVQKVGYVGLVVLPFLAFGDWHLMAGVSVRYNTCVKLNVYTIEADSIYHNGDQIYRISTPLIFQTSWSWNKLFSAGLYYSRDIRPRFKSEVLNNPKQWVIGGSFAIRI